MSTFVNLTLTDAARAFFAEVVIVLWTASLSAMIPSSASCSAASAAFFSASSSTLHLFFHSLAIYPKRWITLALKSASWIRERAEAAAGHKRGPLNLTCSKTQSSEAELIELSWFCFQSNRTSVLPLAFVGRPIPYG